jgi:hypothetical protein
MRNVSDKSCRENQKYILCSINYFVFRKSCRLWDNAETEPNRPRQTIWRMRKACCVTKATNAHPECVILIAFPLQQWLHERASVLRYTYIACLF